MKKSPILYFITILFTIFFIPSIVISGEITDNSFSLIQNSSNVEYNGAVVQLILSGAKPIAGDETEGAVLDKGYPAFAASSIASPTVIKDNGTYKMWFQGFDGSVWRIGYAVSSDGINWSVYSNSTGGMKGAVIGPENSPSFASSHASDPTVIEDNGMYKMWFGGSDGSVFRIGYAVSSDGINWSVYSNSTGGMKGAVIGPENSPSFASSHASDPTVIEDNGMYKMWFRGDDGSIWRIGYAVSSDGINWSVYSNSTGGMKGAVIGPENSPSFASGSVSSYVGGPTVIKLNGMYKIWFHGYDGSVPRIGYAVSSDGINWSVYSNSTGGMKGAVIGPENSPSFASGSVSSYAGGPTVIKLNGIYKIWFNGNDDSVYRIGYAVAVHPSSGSFVSRVLDAGYPVNLEKLYFYANIYDSTSIKFQIRGGNSIEELNNSQFVGPDNTPDTYFTISGESITGITNVRYIEYKAYLTTLKEEYSPELVKVNITYSSLYEQPQEDSNLYLYPAPYKPDTGNMFIRFSLAESCDVDIIIYTSSGEKIWNKSIKGDNGWNIIEWNGCDNNGREMRSGTYICVIKKKYKKEEKYIRKHIFLVR